MHRPDLVQLGQAGVVDLPGEQAGWDHPDDPATVAEGGIGHLTHEPPAAAPVNQSDVPAGHEGPQGTSGIPVTGICWPRVRPSDAVPPRQVTGSASAHRPARPHLADVTHSG